MGSMPQHLLLDILASVDTKSLYQLCLVSKLMNFLSRPLLFRVFEGHWYDSKQSLKRLTIFSRQLQADASLTRQVRSIDVGSVEQPYIRELQAVFEVLLKHTPNLRHLRVPAGQFMNFLIVCSRSKTLYLNFDPLKLMGRL